MLKFLRIGVSAFVLSTLVVGPVMMVVTADQAQAKNDGNNGNGGGNGGGNGKGGGSDKGAGSDRGNGGKSGGGKSASARETGGQGGKGLGQGIQSDFTSLGRSLKSGIGAIFGETPKGNAAGARKVAPTAKGTTAVSRSGSSPRREVAPETSVRPPEQIASRLKEPMHPGNLGKLNGALNSSPRAKEAHIANGNYGIGKGPVSLAAALAVADYTLAQTGAAREAVIAAEETLALAEAFDLVENSPTAAEVDEARAVLDDPLASEEAKALAQAVLDYPDTTAAQAVIAGQEKPSEADLAAAQEVIELGVPAQQDYADAALSVVEIEEAILSGSTGELSEEEADALLAAVRASNPDPQAVGAALERHAAMEVDAEEGIEEGAIIVDEIETPGMVIIVEEPGDLAGEETTDDTVAGL